MQEKCAFLLLYLSWCIALPVYIVCSQKCERSKQADMYTGLTLTPIFKRTAEEPEAKASGTVGGSRSDAMLNRLEELEESFHATGIQRVFQSPFRWLVLWRWVGV